MTFMKQVLQFLQELAANNNREWFLSHKEEYLKAKETFDAFAEKLIAKVSEFDPTIEGLQAKDYTYRIYRDVRFSKDKSPYKTHMGCYICRGGKKSGYSGYYFHIATDEGDVYPTGHMLAVGDYCTDSKALLILREDIAAGEGDFEQIIGKAAEQGFRMDESFKMKRPPKGFNDQTPYLELIKYKSYCLVSEPSTKEILSSDLVENVAMKFKSAKPFLDYINRAIEYVKEGND